MGCELLLCGFVQVLMCLILANRANCGIILFHIANGNGKMYAKFGEALFTYLRGWQGQMTWRRLRCWTKRERCTPGQEGGEKSPTFNMGLGQEAEQIVARPHSRN